MLRLRRTAILLGLSVAACSGDDGAASSGDGTTTGTGSGSTSGGGPSTGSAAGSSSSGDTSTGGTGGATDGGTSTGGTGGTGGVGDCGTPPAGLTTYMTGNAEDAGVTPLGPGLILMGGGPDVDAAFEWWTPLLSGGDIVVIRTSGSDGYNDYLHTGFGAVDSVETLMVDSAALASEPYVACRIESAEGVFMAGGDQATYVEYWKGSGVEDALHAAWARGAIIGGTSAGLAVLGEHAFSALEGTVYPDEMLEDPYNMYATLESDFLAFPPLAGVVTDSHFRERDRMGRLIGFVARIIQDGLATAALGIGVDEETALVVDATGQGQVLGTGRVYLLESAGPPGVCQAGSPLTYVDLPLHRLSAGDTVQLPAGTTDVPSVPLSANAGVLDPADPY